MYILKSATAAQPNARRSTNGRSENEEVSANCGNFSCSYLCRGRGVKLIYKSTLVYRFNISTLGEIMSDDLVWLTIEGLEKKEVLEGMGFKISKSGTLTLNGENVISFGETVKAEDVKAVVPGSLTVITDVSEVESFLDEE